jgi:hypothetical protein
MPINLPAQIKGAAEQRHAVIENGFRFEARLFYRIRKELFDGGGCRIKVGETRKDTRLAARSNRRSDFGERLATERALQIRVRHIGCLRAIGGAADRSRDPPARASRSFAGKLARRHAFNFASNCVKTSQSLNSTAASNCFRCRRHTSELG